MLHKSLKSLFCPQTVTNSSIFFMSVLTSSMGFDLQKCEYSSANRACSKITLVQAELSKYEVLAAIKYSKVKYILYPKISAVVLRSSRTTLVSTVLPSYSSQTFTSFTFPLDILCAPHLTSTINTWPAGKTTQFTEAWEHKQCYYCSQGGPLEPQPLLEAWLCWLMYL